jgi:hypothetical protein
MLYPSIMLDLLDPTHQATLFIRALFRLLRTPNGSLE